MRFRLASLLLLAAISATASAATKDVYLAIGGSVGVFRTDMRIFNPSATKAIQINAYLLATGNLSNFGISPKPITIPKRSMVVYDDVVFSLFNFSGLAAIRLTSDDDFVATQRIYAVSSSGCIGTLGQFVPGVDLTQAKKQGMLIQLKSNGVFRTNMGAVNTADVNTNVTWRLYDKNNALVGTPKNDIMPPKAVISPQSIASYLSAGNADLSEAWISFTSDQPIVAYASVVDNGTTDPTFIPAQDDSGAAAAPALQGKTYTFTVTTGKITVSPTFADTPLLPGETVTIRVLANDTGHGFQLVDPDGVAVVNRAPLTVGAVYDTTYKFDMQGTYQFFCNQPTCSAVHAQMTGTFPVGKVTDPERPGY